MDNLLQLIEQEKINLQNGVNTPNEELEFFKTILKPEEKNATKDLKRINPKDLLLALVRANVDTMLSFYEQIEMIIDCGDILDKIVFKEDKIDAFFDLLVSTLKCNEYYQVKKFLTNGYKPSNADKKTATYKDAKAIMTYVKKYGCKDYDIEAFLEFICEIPLGKKGTMECLYKVAAVISYFEDYSYWDNAIMERAKKAQAKNLIIAIQDARKIMEEIYQELISYYESLNGKEQSKKRAMQKELTALTVLEENLPRLLSSGEIKNIQELLKRITNKDIRLEVLKLVYTHNSGIYNNLEEEYQRLSSSPANKYQSLLNKYGIAKDTYLVASVMGNPLADVEEMLKSITSLGITNPSVILRIVQRSNLMVINSLNFQVTKGIISPSLLQEHPSIFFGDSKEYRSFTTNLAFLKESGLNPYYLKENQELFLLPSQSLRKGFKTLEQYNLLSYMKVGSPCSFLGNENLELGIDTLLELGYEKFLEQNLSLLNYQDKFQRLRVLKELNIPITSKEELEKVLTTDKFLVPDDCIEDYLYNASNYRYQDISLPRNSEEMAPISLDNFKETERTYNIGGVLVSKNRVQRNLDSIKETSGTTNLLYAVTNGSFLSDEEFDTVVAVILPNAKSTVKAKIGQ